MSVSLEYLERCSAETGFQIAALEKVVRLGEMAGEVTRHPLLGRVLALKGGTALNLCFGPPRRLSVDLDFNYVGEIEREGMLADRPRVEQAVTELARRAGYRVQRSADAFAGRKIYLHYRSALGPEERIEVDLNFLFRVPLARPEARGLWQPGKLDRPRVRVVGLDELLAGKLLALLDRAAVRDAWDVVQLPPPALETMASRPFRARFIAIAGILDHPLTTYGRDRLASRVTERAVKEQLTPMLAAGTAVPLGELVERAWGRVEPLVALTRGEVAYIEAMQQGSIRLDLLFPDEPEEAERIARHPALLWKARNARAHRGQQDGASGEAAPTDGPDES